MKIIDDLIDAIRDKADPRACIERHLERPDRPVRIVAFGKASATMMGATLERFRSWDVEVRDALCVTVPGTVVPDGCRAVEADHPLATDRNVEAARAVSLVARETASDESFVALISGGGSAHLTWPAEGLSLEDVVGISEALMRAGAPIGPLNVVRKHVERLKGGRLATIASRGRVGGWALSDVPGDALGVIASGPLSPDDSTYAQALEVLEAYGVHDRFPAITSHLRRGVKGEVDETPVGTDAEVRVIGSNALAVDGACRFLEERGYDVLEWKTLVSGEASVMGERFGRRLRAARSERQGPIAIVWGGETTVEVGDAPGRGGPCQEFTLGACREVHGLGDVVVGAFATDGVDGPTDAAGAWSTGVGAEELSAVRRALHDHDAGNYFEQRGGLIRTGPTGSNVNDVMFGLLGASS